MSDTTAQQIAEHVHRGMFANDRALQALGIAVTEIAPRRATATMAVREDMLNGHDICHGGLISTLADSAFAYACNSYDELTVASGFSVDFVAPGRLGDVLTARMPPETRPEPGAEFRIGIDPTKIHLFDAASERIIN